MHNIISNFKEKFKIPKSIYEQTEFLHEDPIVLHFLHPAYLVADLFTTFMNILQIRSMIIPRDGYYQPRLTTRNVGEALKEYEQVINTPRQEGERIYTKFLKLVSIVLPADEENALWAIEDKATKATNLFKLIHGSFSNDKKMITDIFDVVQTPI